MRHARSVLLFSALAAVAAIGVVRAVPAATHLTVHEWGTFTSVAGGSGDAIVWQPLSGPQDLPCFVDRETVPNDPANPSGLTSVQIKGRDIFGLLKILPQAAGPEVRPAQTSAVARASVPYPSAPPLAPSPGPLPGRVRMETPVIYFYSPESVAASVNVLFRQGVMSEWYPRATVPAVNFQQTLSSMTGSITWPSVRVIPDARPELPRDAVKSHYYAAREVDAAPVLVNGQYEKFLFYRGLADFQPSIHATVAANGDVTAIASWVQPKFILFENHQGKIGYRVSTWAPAGVKVRRPALTGNLDALRADLVSMLVAEGLYEREAKAMVETWRDSWFEEGTRIFYLMSRDAVDSRLPLIVTPTPADVARVFVGRVELITPEMKDDVEHAIVTNDLDALNRYGRFLDSVVREIATRPAIAANSQKVANAVKAVAASYPAQACAK